MILADSDDSSGDDDDDESEEDDGEKGSVGKGPNKMLATDLGRSGGVWKQKYPRMEGRPIVDLQ
jgi:hypothetical protein